MVEPPRGHKTRADGTYSLRILVGSVLEKCPWTPEFLLDLEMKLIRYLRLGYVALNVSDMTRSLDFYTRIWGLQDDREGPDGCHFLRCSDRHHDLILYEGEPGLKRISWELESDVDVAAMRDALRANGLDHLEVPPEESDRLGIGRAIRFSCPYTGVTHEYFVGMAPATSPYLPLVAKIQRVGHVVLKTDRYAQAVDFYMNVLNFRLSDAVGEAVSFMRCFPNPLHHSIGLSNAAKPGLHHVNFMVTEVDDIGKAIWRFQKNDVPVVRGPGRHPPSGSMFLYVLDPDNLTVEYSFGMEEFPEDEPRRPRVLPPIPESLDFWGAPTDKRLGSVGKIEIHT